MKTDKLKRALLFKITSSIIDKSIFILLSKKNLISWMIMNRITDHDNSKLASICGVGGGEDFILEKD